MSSESGGIPALVSPVPKNDPWDTVKGFCWLPVDSAAVPVQQEFVVGCLLFTFQQRTIETLFKSRIGVNRHCE